jgi:hypothetical protein
MITFISSIPRALISGVARVAAFFRHLGHVIIEEEEENRAKLEAEVFCRYNRLISTAGNNHAVRAEAIRWKY